jgi:hypothetical protein
VLPLTAKAADSGEWWDLLCAEVAMAHRMKERLRDFYRICDPDEVSQFPEFATGHRHFVAFRLADNTGMRRGEPDTRLAPATPPAVRISP